MSGASSIRLAIKRLVRFASSAAIRAVSIDATPELTMRSTLVVAPHPDDETLGCASTIARMRSVGTEVQVVFVTGGDSSPTTSPMSTAELVDMRQREALTALAALAVPADAVQFWDFPDGYVAEHVDSVAQQMSALLDTSRVEQVFVTSMFDRHPDHAAASRAVQHAIASRSARPLLFEYAIWQRVPAWGVVRTFAQAGLRPAAWSRARPLVVRSESFARAKNAALATYGSQLSLFPAGFVQDFQRPFETFWPATS